MKAKTLCMLAASLLVSASLASADTLDAETFTVTGKIYQPGTDPRKPIVATTLSVKSLLALFGHPEVKPSSAKFFYDQDTVSDVLASADKMTIYGTLFTYGSSSVNLPGTLGTGTESGPATMLNGLLQGTYFITFKDTSTASKGTNSFIGSGKFGGVNTIVKGRFTYSQPTGP